MAGVDATLSEDSVAEFDLTQKWEDLTQAIHDFAHAWIAAMRLAMEAIARVYESFHEAAWKSYLGAGAPYGESDEGMWRWARECAKAARLRREAEDIETWHRQMADLRRMLTERKALSDG